MKKIFTIISAFILVFVISGCSSNSSSKEPNDTKGKKLEIYTSIYPLQYITEQIGGDNVTVKSIYPPGVDAHTYEPTSKEMTDMAKSDAFIYLGAGMESFAETAASALSKQDVKFIEIAKHEALFSKSSDGHDGHDHGTDTDHNAEADNDHDEHDHGAEADHNAEVHDDHDGHDHGDKDPHIWLDPLRMIDMGAIIKDELITLNPENKKQYEKNYEALTKSLTALDQEFVTSLKDKQNKHILVSHAAYGYWEQRYGIEQIAISGLSSSDEPSQKDLAKIAKLAKEHQIKYVIFEQNASDRVSTIIQEHIKAEALHIHNLEVLTDEDIKNNADYISLMKANLAVLNKATK